MEKKTKETKQTEKSLANKAIDIKGKSYVLVSDRVIYFNETYPSGVIKTEILSNLTDDTIVMKASITPDIKTPERVFIGHSQAKIGDGFINKTSALENAETSAVGRALAMMGIGVIDSIASVDEINKAKNTTPTDARFVTAKNIITSCKEVDKLNEFASKVSSSKNFTDKEKEELIKLITDSILSINKQDEPVITL